MTPAQSDARWPIDSHQSCTAPHCAPQPSHRGTERRRHGEWLRRERRRVNAREELRTAHEMLATMGVDAFAERARRAVGYQRDASRFPLRRLLPFTAIGALVWATAFTLVGYGFSESFESAGENATRIALVGALVIGTVVLALAVRSRQARAEDTSDEGPNRSAV